MKCKILLYIVLGIFVTACHERPKPNSMDDLIPTKAEGPQLDNSERILIEPVADAKGLLGRQVRKREDGSYKILERAPGCNVQFQTEISSWERTITGTADKFAGFSANFGSVAQLQARYSRGIRSKSFIKNEQIINADLSGDCGSEVIERVKIGTGRRVYEYKEEKGGGAGVQWKTVGVGGGSEASESMDFMFRWESPQAWGFTVGEFDPKDQAELSIKMPDHLLDGQVFTPELTTGNRSMWLIIASCWADNECAVLRPCSDIPVEIAPVRRTYKLKSMKAKALEGKDSWETLVVYGFTEEAEFKKMRPPLGALSPNDAAEYVHSIPQKIQEHKIPNRRWANLEFRYVIEGKPVPALSESIADTDATEVIEP